MKTRLGVGAAIATLVVLFGLLVVPSIADPETNLVANGDFESGFEWHGLAKSWGKFDNGGAMTPGWYDDTWAPVIYDGQHSQLIEINTFCFGASDPDRYAGIYQTLSVKAGTTYELCMYGMLRSLRGDPDPISWGYVPQVGIDQTGGSDWIALAPEDWIDVPWDTVYPRVEPGEEMDSFCMKVKAQSDSLTLFIRLWKKWPTNSREVLLNLDGITFKG
jgi:hypothetical protein